MCVDGTRMERGGTRMERGWTRMERGLKQKHRNEGPMRIILTHVQETGPKNCFHRSCRFLTAAVCHISGFKKAGFILPLVTCGSDRGKGARDAFCFISLRRFL